MKTDVAVFALIVCIASVFGEDDKSKTLHKKMIARRREVRVESKCSVCRCLTFRLFAFRSISL